MDAASQAPDPDKVVTVLAPPEQTVPLVFASPHSGRDYPADFVARSRLDPLSLRRSEDSFVDELFAQAAVLHGAPLIAAQFPRAFCDPNREPYELDPAMFSGRLPGNANTRSPRVAAGLGTIAKVVASGAEIYRDLLPVSEIDRRVEHYYRPYHQRLAQLVETTFARFGFVLLVDCHSMPAVGASGIDDLDGVAAGQVDVVLGDCFGAACGGAVVATVDEAFSARGYRVVRNAPYAGGFTTRHYGQPRRRRHALQIELNRALYMDEISHAKTGGFSRLAEDIQGVVSALAALSREMAPS